LDKDGFVKHISNSKGTRKVGESQSDSRTSDGFDMFGSLVRANRMTGDNESELGASPMHKPPSMAIRKTTEIMVDEMQM
jgi:hypothetical protein